MKRVLILLLLFIILSPIVMADDLYKVTTNSKHDVDQLRGINSEPLIRLNDGYLVLVNTESLDKLRQTNLDYNLIKQSVKKEELALDTRLDDYNKKLYPVIFEHDGIRILQVDASTFATGVNQIGLNQIKTKGLQIDFEPLPLQRFEIAEKAMVPLDSLIDLIVEDSLYNYTWRLQQYAPRNEGSVGNYSSRDWIAAKFESFGYDSVLIDSFINGSTQCQNVVAYKVGTQFPNHHVIVGAHRDAVPGSPGADDNGSGTAGVLEIARILADVETDMTIIFALFDAEETGLNGAEHYVDEAVAAGDSIVYMLNMDMIAHQTNTTEAKVFHGTDIEFSNLWIDLADSLVGITGNLSGNSGGSDHYPFSQAGFRVSFIHEQIFSTVYHSYLDSTSYMNFPYMTKLVKASLATVYSVSQTAGPRPSFVFGFPNGEPDFVSPLQQTTFEMDLTPIYGGVVIPGSEFLVYSIDGGVSTSVPLIETAPYQYLVTLPIVDCGQTLTYYLQVDDYETGTIYYPDTDQITLSSITEKTVAFEDDFETDKGWVISGGAWGRGTPTGGGGAWGNPDPSSAYGGENIIGYNLNGDYTNSMPEYHITSPVFDCSDMTSVKLKFWRYLGVEQSIYDHAYIRVSPNGSSWFTVWSNSETITDNEWVVCEYDISNYAGQQSTVQIRFTMGTTDGGWVYCGWNIDDLEVYTVDCNAAPDTDSDGVPDDTDNCPFVYNPNQEDSNQDGIGDACCCIDYRGNIDYDPSDVIDIADLVFFVSYSFDSGPEPECFEEADIDSSGELNIADIVYLVEYMFSGGPHPPGCPY